MAFRRGRQEPDPTVDLDDVLASYEVTRVTSSSDHMATGLPTRAPASRTRAEAPVEAVGNDGDDADGADAATGDAVDPDLVVLVPGESLDLEVVDLDGTGYLFRGLVVTVGEVAQVAISARTADELLGWDVLTSGAQVVAVLQRVDESWLLTTSIIATSWAEAAAIVDLSPPRRALSTGRRVHPRVERAHRVLLPADLPCARAETIDLSPGGAAIELVGAPPPPGGPFELIVLLPDPTELTVVVTGSRAGEEPDTQVWHVQFVVVPAMARQRLLAATE